MIKKIINLISNKKKFFFFYIIVLNFFSTILELIGIGVVFPLVLFLTKPITELNLYKPFKLYIDLFGVSSNEQLMLLTLLIACIFFLLKTIFLIYKSYHEGKFIFELKSEISEKLFFTYLNKDYIFFFKKNSSSLIQNVTNITNSFIETIIMPFLVIIPEILLIFSFVSILIFFQFDVVFYSFIVIFIPSYLFYKFFRKSYQNWGRQHEFHNRNLLKELNQSLGSIKDIILNQKQKFFFKNFSYHSYWSSYFSRNSHVVRNVSRFYLEFIAVLGFVVFIYFSLKIYKTEDLLPILAIIFAGVIRILPSSYKVLSSWQLLKYGKINLKILTQEISESSNKFYNSSINDFIENKKKTKFNHHIEFKNITFYYEKKLPIFKNLNLKIYKNKIIGILGGTGSGKTTFIDILTGLLRPQKGLVLADNENIHKDLSSWFNNINYLSQSVVLLDDSIMKNIAFGQNEDQIDFKRLDLAIKFACLDSYINSLPKGIRTIVGERGIGLSGGQIQRIGVARSIYKKDVDLYIFDESTNALDLRTEMKILTNLNKLKNKKTIILISHHKSMLKICDTVYELKNHKIKKIY
jgi:ABC-type branched-subunit amino acid transport system ATPase component